MQISSDSRPYYERIGGEDGVRRLVHRFYQLMDSMPEAKGIRDMHEDLAEAEERLFMFFSGWMGGPKLYIEKYGHPRLRMRHMPFSIGNDESRQWMLCMGRALDETVKDEALREELKADFYKIADFMRNQAD
ncbi:MAG TPA: group II truncated hemoglobin [Mariprofundaceae bacterium]|nr:group II truncated hemoglobin [Mariprofundaceae bacterium]